MTNATPQPDSTFPYPRVQHVAVIDLSGDYYGSRSVLDDLHEQARYIPDGAHIRILLGESAATEAALFLEQGIAQRFAHAASIDVELPGGSRWGRFAAQNVDRHVREARAAHAQFTAQLRNTA
ncbi:hypothetical protein [Streptomyces sp. NPDC018833]|uniref:hypothetical protein n=1 Tax=Streptomyces sp. NPDC018833 TaxID=3365053 RepID=UPI0037A8AE6F